MQSIQVPVLISRYQHRPAESVSGQSDERDRRRSESLFTARVIDGPQADACGATMRESLAGVKSLLRRAARRDPDQHWPRIDDFSLQHTSVQVRLFYRDGKRQFPASRDLKLPVRYVVGRYTDGSVECFLVDYDVVFYCPTKHELASMIHETVRHVASHWQSHDMMAAVPPEESELRIVRVRLLDRDGRGGDEPLATLASVADPVSVSGGGRAGAPVRHRENETARLLHMAQRSSVLLVGPSGCGKTSLARLVGRRMHVEAKRRAKEEETYDRGEAKAWPPMWLSSADHLVAGMQYLGQWEERLESVIAELDSIGGTLLVSSLIDLVRLGGSGPTDSLASFLMPYVRRGEIRLMAECSPDELDAARRLLPGWVECFQIMNIAPLSIDQTRIVVRDMLSEAARNHRWDIEPTVATFATRLFAQFMPYQSPPRGVVELISDVIEETKALPKCDSIVEGNDALDRVTIDNDAIVRRFTRLTGLSESILRDDVTLSAESIGHELSGRVMGQSAAVDAVVATVLRLKAGLCDPRRPIATMLFCGPTGVGKTQLTKALAEYLFGRSDRIEKPLVRLDMSEFASWDAVERFLVGSDGEVAPWIARVRLRPMSVVLFDEIEKASPEVLDCLLSALDEGRITDRFGRTTTLCGSILVMTSNVGSRSSSTVGFGGQDHRATRRAIEQEFRPEFLNRLDEVLVFDSLSESTVRRIVAKELDELANSETLRERGVTLRYTDDLVQRLASVGFDPLLGARPLQRTIARQVVARIARRLLAEPSGSRPIIDLDAEVDGPQRCPPIDEAR